ncbi:MAG: CdaR family protein [Pyrinomonadaceae bacterium]
MPSKPTKQLTSFREPAERWTKRIFLEDWSLKLLALTITLALWFFVSAHQSEREVVVEPQIEGNAAPTFEVKDVVITPSKVKVQGRADRLNTIEKVTLPIPVEGRRESFEMQHLTLPISDPGVEALSTVNVRVTIAAAANSMTKPAKVN